MKFISTKRLVTYILQHSNEIDIFNYYTGIPIVEISECINSRNYKTLNRLRNENDPSVGFKYKSVKGGIRLYMIDYGDNHYSGDIFHIAGVNLGLNCNDPNDFITICNDIIANVINKTNPNKCETIQVPKKVIENEYTEISCVFRPFNQLDELYWNKNGITKEYRDEFHIYAIEEYYINGKKSPYIYDVNDPCYGYYLGYIRGLHRWKLYFPFRRKSKVSRRFHTNYLERLEGLNELTYCKNLIITKARKDKILITRMLRELGDNNTRVTNISGENVILTANDIFVIRNISENRIVLFDKDYTGYNASKYYRENYSMIDALSLWGVHSEFIEGFKDISDYAFNKGYDKALDQFAILHHNIKL